MSVNKLINSNDLSEDQDKLFALLLEREGLSVSQSRIITPREESDNPPLSFSQERLWLLDQIFVGTTTLNMPGAVRLKGKLDVAILQQSLNEVVRRHESLRTSFVEIKGCPFQVIAPRLALTVALVDLSEMSEREREAEVLRLSNEEALRPFELARGPLLRVTALRLRQQEHVVLLNMHHIISDGWSMGVLLKEVGSFYEAYSQGKPLSLPSLPIQYADYAVCQREWLQGDVLEDHISYWRERLANMTTLELPTDRPRPAMQTYSGGRQILLLPKQLTRSLKTLGHQEGTTLFMTLLSAFEILLQRYTGQEDIAVGTPIAGRSWKNVEGLIGFFLNTLVMRVDLSGDPTFRQLLARVREVTLEAYSHQDVPFEKILQELQPERDLSRSPLFQVYFNMLNFPDNSSVLDDLSSKIKLPGLNVESVMIPTVESKFDVTLYVQEKDEGIEITTVYNANLFNPERISEMAEQFKAVLWQAVKNPGERISRVSLLTPKSRAVLPNPTQILSTSWQGSVAALFSKQARTSPLNLAVIENGRSITYGELESRSNRLANYLRESGIQQQDVVAVYAHRSAALVWAVMGILKAGAAFTILDPAYPEARLREYINEARPRGWIQLMEAAPPSDDLNESLAALQLCFRLELPEFFSPAAQDLLAAVPDCDPGVEAAADDLAYIAFTSGSTGRPKGILGRQGPLSHFTPWQVETFGLDESDRYSMLSGLSHDPLHRDMFTPLQTGAAICIPASDEVGDSARLADWLKRDRVTIAHLTPATGQLLAEGASAGGRTTSFLRYAFFVGDVLTRRDINSFKKLAPEVRIVNYYGTTETQRSVSYFVVHDQQPPRGDAHDSQATEKEILPLGRGIKDVQLLVINSAKQLAGIGEVGEIYFRSPHLARGYTGDESLTRERFVDNWFTKKVGDRLYRTGDLGRYMPDGNVEALGRADLQIKIRGFRIEPGEIEAVLGHHTSVKEAIVVAREDRAGDKRLVAYVVFQPGEVASDNELHIYLKQRVPSYMIPSVFVALEALPLTPNGKVYRQALPDPSWQKRDSAHAAPRTAAEELLASIWSQSLGIEKVGIYDNFFELGGHSLLATQVISRMRNALEIEIPLLTLFESPTIAEFAKKIEATSSGSALAPRISRVSRDGSLPISFAQQRLWFFDQLQPGSAAYNMAAALRLEGKLNVKAIEQSLHEIIRRHEVLRSCFITVDGEPKLAIAPEVTFSLSVISLQHLPREEREAEAARLAAEMAQQPFTLSQAPLLRTSLFKLDERDFVLLFAMHHIISDGWSMGVLFRELAAHYDAICNQQPPPLEDPPLQYVDYASWQRNWLQGETLQSQLDYWKQQLGSSPGILELPADRPRPLTQSYRGARYSFTVARDLTALLKRMSEREASTLFITLMAAFQALLYRYTEQTDISVGTPIAGRRWNEVENLIGNFANTLVLRLNFAGEHTFAQLLKQARRVALEAYAHQDVPFEQVVEALQPDRNLARNPLFQVLFALQDFPLPTLELPDLTLTPQPMESSTARFDLALEAREGRDGLVCSFEYSTDLFDASSIANMATHFCRMLKAVVENPEQRIKDIPAITEQEQDHLRIKRRNALKQARQASSAFNIAITATFTAEPLEDSLKFWIKEFGLDPKIQFAPYNQVLQQLLDPSSLVSRNTGVNVVLLRLEDWERFYERQEDEAEARATASEKIYRHARELISALKAAVEMSPAPFILCVAPSLAEAEPQSPEAIFFNRTEEFIKNELRDLPGVYVIGDSETSAYRVETFYDPHADRIGHVPFTQVFYTAMGTSIARRIHAIFSQPYKAIAVDCDETLWKGVCGEDGPRGVELDEPRRLLQEFLVARYREGMLVCLCSKNNEEDVDEVFNCRPEMPLKPEMIVARRLNWSSKSDNIIALAGELQIGLDSFIFIDDNPIECAEVEANCPEVLALTLPNRGPDFIRFFEHVWAFDQLKTTSEDKRRTTLYQQNAQRERLRKSSTSLQEFIASLDLRVTTRPLAEDDIDRVSQLTQRTNQFNCTTIRRDEREIAHLCRNGNECLIVEVSDRFGDYGLAGVLIYDNLGEKIATDTFLLSCRVLGRGVEHKVFARLGEIALQRGVTSVDIRFIPSKKNKPAQLFLESIPGAVKREQGDGWIFTLTAEQAARLRFSATTTELSPSAELDSPAGETGEPRATASAVQKASGMARNPALLKRIASDLNEAEKIHKTIESGKQWKSRNAATLTSARTETEDVLTVLCEQLLRVDGIGVNDNFFDIGGHSLVATQLLSRIRQAFQVELSLETFFASPTVAGLARQIEKTRLESNGLKTQAIERVDRSLKLPLSFSQQRVWILDQINPGNTAYNISVAIRIRGDLDAVALARSLGEIVKRHESLRTSIIEFNGEPVQVIEQAQPLALPVIDLRREPESAREEETRRLALEQAQQPFMLDRGPLFRVALAQLGQQEHVLLFTIHHLISDGWSIGVLLRELAALYEAFSNGKPSPLPGLPIQYADFAHWQRRWLQGDLLESHFSYWRGQLAGARASTELPTDHPRPETRSYRGARKPLLLASSLTQSLKSLSRNEGATLFMTLLAALNVLVRRHTNQDDIVIATGIANRNLAETEGLIGFFVNQLPLRTRLCGDDTFDAVLRRVRDVTVGAYVHQDLPFDKLVDGLGLERDITRSPLSQIVMILHNTPATSIEIQGLSFDLVEFDHVSARFDVEFSLTDTKDGLSGYVEYNSDLFEERTIARLIRQFEELLRAIVEKSDARVDELQEAIDQSQKDELISKQKRLKEANLKSLRSTRRSGVMLPQSEMVKAEPMNDSGMPLLMTPRVAEINLASWAQSNHELLRASLARHGAILFRGFNIKSVSQFEQFAGSVCGELLEYNERSTPRTQAGGRVYTSTEYPAYQHIPLHNENSYSHRWPMKIFFCCLKAAREGGETPIADSARVFESIDARIKQRFMEKKVMYVRNFGEELDLPWQVAFQTNDRSRVEQYCRASHIEFEWKDGNRLRTRQVRQVVAQHPTTGKVVWFNQAHLFHVSSLDAAVRESLLATFDEDDYPRNALYGDGSRIEESMLDEIRQVYKQSAITFSWQEGDVILLDNMLAAHGRAPFVGPRSIVVAMGESYGESFTD
jgi:amino acid adenylation domain-containing protein/FkbH-like protein